MKILGSHLGPALQSEVKAAFIYRLTRENPYGLSVQPGIKPLFETDKQWLASTFFEITKKGKLSKRSRYCESKPKMETKELRVRVDVPLKSGVNNPDESWTGVAGFSTREEAIRFTQEHFGADDQGRVCLVTGEEVL